jgi:low affinity Fe/Cu permease
VPAVVPHRFAEQTRGDADARPIAHAMILSMPKRKEGHSLGHKFETMSTVVTRWTGSTPAFGVALAVIVGWAVLGPVFRFSDTWQLVINTGTTIVTFLMVFLIQRSQNKDSLAIHIKLNEIVAALEGASNRLIDADHSPRMSCGLWKSTIRSCRSSPTRKATSKCRTRSRRRGRATCSNTA